MLLSLHRDGLLYLDYDQKRWSWDEDGILSMKLPDNVASCFANGINKLPMAVQAALHALSIFGTSVEVEYIQLIETAIRLSLIDPLKQAALEGLVFMQRGVFHFCHERIQEVSYKMVEEPTRARTHLVCGRCLVRHAYAADDNDMLFVAVNQINLAGPSSISQRNEFIEMAQHNLLVGKRAMSISAFSAANSFFCHGISFLGGDNYWRNKYNLCLELYELASKSALASGKIQEVQIYFDEVIKHARRFDDTLNAHYIHLTALATSAGLVEAMKKGVFVLAELGEDLPSNPSDELINFHIQNTQNIIKGVSEEDILALSIMTNEKKRMVMKFLSRMQGITLFAAPAMHKLIVMRMIEMTMSYGLSPPAAFGFACFGSLLQKMGNLSAGKKFILLAKSVLDKLGAIELAGEVMTILAEATCYMEPLLAGRELRTQGEEAATSVGDFISACPCRLQYVTDSLWGGENLSVLENNAIKAESFIKQFENNNMLAILFVIRRSIHVLIGNETETLTMDQLSDRVNVVLNARQKMVL